MIISRIVLHRPAGLLRILTDAGPEGALYGDHFHGIRPGRRISHSAQCQPPGPRTHLVGTEGIGRRTVTGSSRRDRRRPVGSLREDFGPVAVQAHQRVSRPRSRSARLPRRAPPRRRSYGKRKRRSAPDSRPIGLVPFPTKRRSSNWLARFARPWGRNSP